MYIQEDDLKLNDWQFSQRKYLPYETKLRLTETRIREWHYNWEGQVYLSYSAGLDSTVLLHMIRKILENDVPAVFSNTGLEFPEIVKFARKAPDEDEMVSVADIAVSTLMEIEEQPTAFDVEKVVRELRDLKMRYYFTIANTGDADKDCAYLNTANAIDKAIEIVKRGGRDEE